MSPQWEMAQKGESPPRGPRSRWQLALPRPTSRARGVRLHHITSQDAVVFALPYCFVVVANPFPPGDI